MKAFIYTILFCICTEMLHAQCGSWQTATTSTTQHLYALHFPDSLRGWAVGRNGTIITSTNAGANWSSPQSTNTTEILYGVHMVNSTLGWAVGAAGTVLKTTNGTSWVKQNNIGTSADLFDVWFTDSNNGLIVGSCGTHLRTTNGGSTWTSIMSGQTDYNLKQVKVLANGRAALCSTGNNMLYAATAGGTWSSVAATPRGMRAFDMEPGGTGLSATYTGEIIKTTNSGQSWSNLTPPSGTNYWQSISMVSANEAVIAGLQGKMFRTTNGGTSWTAFNTGVGTTDLYGVQMWNGNLGWAVGTDGKVFRYVAANLPTATATVAQALCAGGTGSLAVNTNATTPSYAWAGPSGFTNTTANPSISTAGTYTVTVTNTASGCTNTSTVSVTTSASPSLTVAPVTLTCTTPTATLIPTTNATSPTYAWAGPSGFTSTSANPSVSNFGNYTVTVTNTANGCTAVASGAFVTNNTSLPNISVAANNNGVLNCALNSLTLTASSTTPGATITGGTTTASTSQVSQPGTYSFTVTNPANGCTSTASQVVTQNLAPPTGITTQGGVLTCAQNNLQIMANTTTPGSTYAWSGPANYTSALQNPSVSAAGVYTVTITPPSQCTATATATVTADQSVPTASINTQNQTEITCISGPIPLTGASSIAQSTWSWSGPGITNSGLQNQTAAQAGTYTLVVTAPNSCTGVASVAITQNVTPPQLQPAASGILTCNTQTVSLSAAPTGTVLNYTWSGPGINAGNNSIANPQVGLAGNYAVTVTGTNGCTNSGTVQVSSNTVAPGATATGGQITCMNGASLTANSGTAGVTYIWSGPGVSQLAQQSISVNQAGTFTVTVTGTNGCTTTATAQAVSALPVVSLSGSTSICLGATTISLPVEV